MPPSIDDIDATAYVRFPSKTGPSTTAAPPCIPAVEGAPHVAVEGTLSLHTSFSRLALIDFTNEARVLAHVALQGFSVMASIYWNRAC